MKKMTLVLGAFLAAAALQFAAPATSVPNSNIARRVTALESKVKTLQKSVASARADVSSAKERLACISAAGLTQYGNAASQIGYVWTQAGTLYVSTALDLTPEGQSPLLYVAAIDSSCVTSASRMFAATQVSSGRPLNALHK